MLNRIQSNTEMANTEMAVDTAIQTDDAAYRGALVNPYGARYATVADAVAIDHVVREAFGASAPKTSSERDMKRRNTTYIVATRGTNWNGDDANVGSEGNGGFSRRLRSILSVSLGSSEPQRVMSNIVGLVGIWTAADQAHIVVIATRPNRRGHGVGELLLIATMTEALKVGTANATLEVRKSNLVARSLYRKYGFSDVGVRRQYYHDNREDAIIMSTPSFSDLGYRRSLRHRFTSYFAARGQTELQVDPMQYLALPE